MGLPSKYAGHVQNSVSGKGPAINTMHFSSTAKLVTKTFHQAGNEKSLKINTAESIIVMI